MKNLSKRKKITITSIVSILLIGMVALLILFKLNKNEEPQEEVPTTVRIQGDNASLNGVVIALDGEVIVDEDDIDTTIFKAEEQEVIVTLGSDVAIVNGEKKPFTKEAASVVATETEDIAQDDKSDVTEEVNQSVAYVDKDEVFVPIEFVEDVFDLEFNDETLEFVKDGEVIIGGEAEELPEVEESDILVDKEDNENDDVDLEEESTEENDTEKPSDTPEPSEKPAEGNNTTQTVTKPTTPENSSNSTTSSNSNQSTSSGLNNSSSNNSNNQSKPETSTPAPTPEPQPVKVTSLTTSTGNLTLEVGQSSKMSVTVNPSNADNKSVTFSSSNSGVATVDGSGNIVAKGAGTATITAKSNENENINVSIVVTVNEKPKPQPTYTGSTIVNRLVNELGWCRGGSDAFLGPYGCDTGLDGRWVEVDAMNGANGYDVSINIMNSQGTGVVSGVESVIRWMMPSTGQQIINKLHDPNFYGGTFENMDGRKVVVELTSYGIGIRIYPKY